jgi:uncharacterized membrane protein YphA (DoxX/SURF4 family)
MKIAWERVFDLTLWVLQVFLSLSFLYFGLGKFNPHEIFWHALFARMGVGPWFRLFSGGLEVACAVFLLPLKTSSAAAALLACAMAAAVLVHLFMLRDGLGFIFPGFMLIALLVVACGRRRTGS